MAIGLINFPNIYPPDGDFLSGRIKDNPGDNSGTPVNQLTNGDIQEFFAKLMNIAGITPNGSPDCEYTGHQFHQALIYWIMNWGAFPSVQGLIPNYVTNTVVILSPITMNIVGSVGTWSSGSIYYNGKIYLVKAGTANNGGETFVFKIQSTDIPYANIQAGISGTGISDFSSAIPLANAISGQNMGSISPIALPLVGGSGIVAASGTPTIQLDVFGNLKMNGVLINNNSSGTSGLFAILPAGYRPQTDRVFSCYGSNTGVDKLTSVKIYASNGDMYIQQAFAQYNLFYIDNINYNINF
jgi:hypothetical protein